MKEFSFSEARQKFSAVLDCTQQEGAVRVARRDGRVFVIQPLRDAASSLAVKGIDLGLSEQEIVDLVHRGRRI